MLQPIVMDGDFNSQVAAVMGKSMDNMPSMLSILKDEITTFNTYMEFLRAGANMIRTNTFRVSVRNLNHFIGVNYKDCVPIITNVASLARKAVLTYENKPSTSQQAKQKNRPYVVGFCGPYGASLGDGSEYTGAYGNEVSQKKLMEWHKPRVKALLDAGVDVLALGSVPCSKEAAAFVDLLRQFPSIRVWITFYCYNDRILADGSDFRTIVNHCHRVLGHQMIAIGVSCVECSLVSPLFNAIHRETFPEMVPLVACPDKTSYRFKEDLTVEIFPNRSSFDLPISEWLNSGASIIGGCCGTVAQDIKYIHSEVEKYSNRVKQKKCSISYNRFFDSGMVKTKL